MRLTTWNVNGMRNPFSYPPWNNVRTFPAMFDILESDIVVMQELKIQRKDLKDDMVLLDGWDCYFSLPRHKKGYSGVAIYTRNAVCAPIKAEEGLLGVLPSPSGVPYRELPADERIGGYPDETQTEELLMDPAALDAEGRCVVVEFPAFVLLGIYSPANSNGLRDDFRHNFIRILDHRVRNLVSEGKRVVLVGDLNVSRDEIDSASAMDDVKKSGITHEEYISTPNRRIFNQMLVDGEVIGQRDQDRKTGILWDTTRAFHPDRRGMYTHWEQKINARPGNFGARIDFILVSQSIQSWVQDANIQEGLLGSDHCPVFADFKDKIALEGNEINLVDLMNPTGMFESGSRRADWRLADIPTFSARRLPEFDKRRSIKAMFSASKDKFQSSQIEADITSTEVDIANSFSTYDGDCTQSNYSSFTENPSKKLQSRPYSLKRPKSIDSDSPSKRLKPQNQPTKGKGQQTLMGFFNLTEKTASTNTASPNLHGSQKTQGYPSKVTGPSKTQLANTERPDVTDDLQSSGSRSVPSDIEEHVAYVTSPPRSISPSPSMVEAHLATVEENQRSWGSLFARPIAPLCEGHNEPCKVMQTKKKGSNQGRSFWMCARPLGPSGSKERGTQWRCPTFMWCSTWDGKREK